MTDHRSIRRLVPTFPIALCILLAALLWPIAASASGWEYRMLGQWSSASGDGFGEAEEGPGVYMGLERRLTDRWGVEVGLGWNRLEDSMVEVFNVVGFEYRSRLETEVEWLPLSVAGNFHLTPDSKYDVYVSARVGWAFFDDARFKSEVSFTQLDGFPFVGLDQGLDSELRFETEDSFFYGIGFGVDREFGTSGWALSATVDWTALELEYDPSSAFEPPFIDPIPTSASLDLDPVTVGLGFSKSW